jgi:YcxB-like protein
MLFSQYLKGCFSCRGRDKRGECLAFGALLATRIMVPRKARRIFAQTPALQRPYQVTWDDRALTSTSQQGAGMYPWAEFHKSREIAGLFLIFLSDVMFIMVPKRDFPDGMTMRNFRECTQTRVRPTEN